MKSLQVFLVFITSSIILAVVVVWSAFYRQGRHFALRDTLQKADAIIVLAGTRGNLRFLEGKMGTAVSLYQQGWAPYLICSGKFSMKVTETPQLISLEELQALCISHTPQCS